MAGAATDLSTAVKAPSGTIFVVPSGNCFVQAGGMPYDIEVGITHNGSGSCIIGLGSCFDVESFAVYENDPTLARGVDDSGSSLEPDANWNFEYDGSGLGTPFILTGGPPAPDCDADIPSCAYSGGPPPTHVDVELPWCIGAAPATYVLKACAKATHTGGGPPVVEDECSSTGVNVQVSVVTVEYVAPPARANRYMREVATDVGDEKGPAHGYIISTIARFHGMEERYGPHGGSSSIDTCGGAGWCADYGGGYDDQCIADDVEDLFAYWQTCEGTSSCETDLDALKGSVVDATCDGGA